MKKYKYLFGPVCSWRFGRSLGVDLVPPKTCSYDCIYCQLGRTSQTTLCRKSYYPTTAILEELVEVLETEMPPDVITLSGSGEPTLHSGIGDLIENIKQITNIPVAVLTNGSLLWQSDVRDSLLQADIVAPSLDAGSPLLFRSINRPHPDLIFDEVVNGIVEFSHSYSGKLWLEVLLIDGYTTPRSEVSKLSRLTALIKRDKTHLCSVNRPPAEDYAHIVSKSLLEKLAGDFPAPVEIRASTDGGPQSDGREQPMDEQGMLALLKRRPCTANEIAVTLGTHPIYAVKALDILRQQKKLRVFHKDGCVFYGRNESCQ